MYNAGWKVAMKVLIDKTLHTHDPAVIAFLLKPELLTIDSGLLDLYSERIRNRNQMKAIMAQFKSGLPGCAV
jgi:hypothetical protein